MNPTLNILILLFSYLTLQACNGSTATLRATQDNSKAFSSSSFGETVQKPDSSAFIIFQDQAGNYWFGSDGNGIYRYDGEKIIHFSEKDGLCNNRIREIREDDSGNIYINTLKGISKFDGRQFQTLTVARGKDWKLGPRDLWFQGGPGKNGPYRFDGDSLYSLEFPKHEMEDAFYERFPNVAYSPYEVYTIFRDRKDNIWLGTSNFGICRFDGKSLDWMYEEHLTHIESTGGSFGIRSILEDHDRKFWICNTQYRFAMLPTVPGSGKINYEHQPGIANIKSITGNDFIYFMSAIEDDDGDLWMASYEQGVWRYDGREVRHYPQDFTIYSIFKDRQGDIWLGTHAAGPMKFNGEMFESFKP